VKEVSDSDFIQRFVALLLSSAEPRQEKTQGIAFLQELQQRLAFVSEDLRRRIFNTP